MKWLANYQPKILPMDREFPLIMDHTIVEGPVLIHEFPWEYIFGCLALGFLYLVARQSAVKLPEKPPERVKENALQSLQELIHEDLPPKLFYEKITDIMRNYIEKRYHLPVLKQTTEEFLQNLDTQSFFGNEAKEALVRFLESADRVKFARQMPSKSECALAKKTAEEFIHK